jgi:hypothetical protein
MAPGGLTAPCSLPVLAGEGSGPVNGPPRPSDGEALDAYSEVVIWVAERLGRLWPASG